MLLFYKLSKGNTKVILPLSRSTLEASPKLHYLAEEELRGSYGEATREG